ncbi:MAG TPA: hypothetical protein VNL69_06020 [Bacteroidota bacterium]|nr:hypothetical protein [Bacteroidota bacterium]
MPSTWAVSIDEAGVSRGNGVGRSVEGVDARMRLAFLSTEGYLAGNDTSPTERRVS